MTVLHSILTALCVFPPTDTDYISEEEKQKVELMLAFLTEESKQAAASTAVSTIGTASCCCCQSITDVLCPRCVMTLIEQRLVSVSCIMKCLLKVCGLTAAVSAGCVCLDRLGEDNCSFQGLFLKC